MKTYKVKKIIDANAVLVHEIEIQARDVRDLAKKFKEINFESDAKHFRVKKINKTDCEFFTFTQNNVDSKEEDC